MPGFVQPTIWNLSNTATGLQVSYSVAGPNLHYHQGPFVKPDLNTDREKDTSLQCLKEG